MIVRRRLDPLAEALADCLERIEWGEAPEAALARHPSLRADIGPLVEAAGAARATGGAEPDPGFRLRLRLRLDGAALARREARAIPWWRKLAPAGATLAALVFGVGGVVAVSAESLPGSALYPVKLAVEDARLALARGRTERMWLRLNSAERRLLEARSHWERDGVVWQGLLLEMAGLTETVLDAYEREPDDGAREVLGRIPLLGDRERALLEEIADRAPADSARRLALMLLDRSAAWNERADRAVRGPPASEERSVGGE